MKKLLVLVCFLGLLAFAGTAFGLSFTRYTPTSSTFSYSPTGFSSSSTFTSAPTGFGFGSAIAFGCGDCFTLNTTSFSTTETRDGWNGSISTAGASAYVSTIICEEPPVCEDSDRDGVCDESDNCVDDPNTDQNDADDDQVGDICDNCPEYANNDQADWDGNGVGNVCDPANCLDGVVSPDCIHGDPNTDCTPTYPEVGICEPAGCPPGMDDDQDGVCDPGDLCPDSEPGSEVDQNGCVPCNDIDGDSLCDNVDDCLDTPPGVPIDSFGCSTTEDLLEAACPCENDWARHGEYVNCTVQFRNDHKFDDPPLIDLDHIVSEAGCSDCGGSHQGQGCD